MRSLRTSLILSMVLAGWSLAASAAPDPTPDITAEVVFLRNQCDVNGSPKENCFESMSSLLTWTWGPRNPGPTDRLRVDVGPGEFGAFECPSGEGWVSMFGSGRLTTIVGGTSSLASGQDVGGIAQGCEDLEFSDMTFEGDYAGFWWVAQGGNSTWQGVDIISNDADQPGLLNETFSWLEEPGGCGAESPVATHYFFDSRVIAFGARKYAYTPAVFWTGCSDVWYYGGEITWKLDDLTSAAGAAQGYLVEVGSHSKMQVFGTALRIVGSSSEPISALTGVGVTGTTSEYHQHGGIISHGLPNIASGFAIGLLSSHPGSLIHTPGTAFVARVPATAGYARVSSGSSGRIESPFLWQSGATPPLSTTESNVIFSESGKDMYVETDCQSSGTCTGGNETHLMIYNSTMCTGSGGPWFDTVTGACRP